ncbi:MAG TPA: hypothetical protein VE972_06825 [Conexibacter sp.]|nr:hypothetical protein [Conexibacter sp.]
MALALAAGTFAATAMAQHGADDPVAHHQHRHAAQCGERHHRNHAEPGDDRGGHRENEPGDDRGGR